MISTFSTPSRYHSIMGGSQLKALKASLKSHGLIGQTNTKGKGKGSKKPSDRNRQDKEKVLANIRDAFSPFDVKTTKQKYDVVGGRRVQGAVGRPGISKQIGEENVSLKELFNITVLTIS